MYNIGKMRDGIRLLRRIEDSPIMPLDSAAEYKPITQYIPAQRIKRMDSESIRFAAEHNKTRVDFIIRLRELDVDMVIECQGEKHNIIGFEALKDDSGFLLISTYLMR